MKNNSPKTSLFSLNSLGSRVLLSFGGIIIAVLILVWLNELQIKSLIRQENMLLHTLQNSQNYSSVLYNAVNKSNMILHEQLIYENIETRQLRKKIWQEDIQIALDSLEVQQKYWTYTDLKLKFETIRMNLKKLRKYQDEVEQLIDRETTEVFYEQDDFSPSKMLDQIEFQSTINAKAVFKRKLSGGGLISQLNVQFEDLQKLQMADFKERQSEINTNLNFNRIIKTLVLVLLLFIISIIGFLLIQRAQGQFSQIDAYLRDLSQGDIPQNVEIPDDETAPLMENIQKLSINLHKIKEFAKTVGEGNFNDEILIFEDQGELSESLKEMHSGLLTISSRDKQRNWTNEGIALFGSLLREYHDAQTLYDNLISNMVKYLRANQGGIFILRDQDPDGEKLELLSVYAYDRKRFVDKIVYPGQGLVGQSWREKDIIYLENTNREYVQIVSGLGGANPRSVLIVPLINNESKVLGVLEIASFQKFQHFEIDFVKRVGEMIVSAISALKNNEKNRILLEEAQKATEQMRIKEEEMRQNLSNLITAQYELRKNHAELIGQTVLIDDVFATAKLDMKGNFLEANEAFLKAIEYTREEIFDQPYTLLVSDIERKSPEYRHFWQDILDGNIQHTEVRRYSKYGKELWFEAFFVLVYDENKMNKYIFHVALDITAKKSKFLSYQQQWGAVSLTQAVAEFDKEGIITAANPNFLKMLDYRPEEILGKSHKILISDLESNSHIYKEFWIKLNRGLPQNGKFKLLNKSGRMIWAQGSYNALYNADQKIYKFIFVAQDITEDMEKAIIQDSEVLQEQQNELRRIQERLKAQEEELLMKNQKLNAMQSEVEKQQTELRSRMVAINATVATAELSLEGAFIEANDLFLDMTKYKLIEIIGTKHDRLMERPFAESPEYQQFWGALQRGIPQVRKFKLIAKDGTEIWLKSYYTPIRDTNGEPFKIISLSVPAIVALTPELG